jgi:hypothetical protein
LTQSGRGIQIVAILLGFFSVLVGFDDVNAEYRIIQILSNEKVLVNISSDTGIGAGQVFQVFGEKSIVHPATGKLIVRENVLVGKIKVLEVSPVEATCLIIDQSRFLEVGDRLEKVASGSVLALDEQEAMSSEFDKPRNNEYSKSVYTRKTSASKKVGNAQIESADFLGYTSLWPFKIFKVEPNILPFYSKPLYKININSGEVSGFKVGFHFPAYKPMFEISKISGERLQVGREQIGRVYIDYSERTAAQGLFIPNGKFSKDLDIDLLGAEIEYLRQYHTFLGSNFMIGRKGDIGYDFTEIRYQFSQILQLGIKFSVLSGEREGYVPYDTFFEYYVIETLHSYDLFEGNPLFDIYYEQAYSESYEELKDDYEGSYDISQNIQFLSFSVGCSYRLNKRIGYYYNVGFIYTTHFDNESYSQDFYGVEEELGIQEKRDLIIYPLILESGTRVYLGDWFYLNASAKLLPTWGVGIGIGINFL